MATLIVPSLDPIPLPTLGPQVCDFIEAYLVHGPGDLRGEPARLDSEKRALIYRMYEVFPQGHIQAGRRRFKRVAISLRKGSAKTEFAAWIAICELHSDGPVRCDGFDADGHPVGRGVIDPYIPMIAYTEEQTEELAYGALRIILENSPLASDFDIGLARVMRGDGSGKAVPLASSPNSTDGARTTFQHFDETHRFTLDKLRKAHRTMQANIPKRKLADAWSLETTTAPTPGENSVAEDTMEYARQVADGKIQDAKLFFFHRQASDKHKIYNSDGTIDMASVRAAVLEASGPIAEWSDIDGIVDQFADPTTDKAYLERVWFNRLVRASDKAFDAEQWKRLVKPGYAVPDGELITLGFDGSRSGDSTALVGTHLATGHQFVLGVWEHPAGVQEWEVPEDEVEDKIAAAFDRWDVWRMYADPFYWETYVAKWAGQYGKNRDGTDKVWQFRTNQWSRMGPVIRSYSNAILKGELSHDGNKIFAQHIGNACRREIATRDENGEHFWVIYKERKDSPHKIDAAMAAALSWEARNVALAAGVDGQGSVYDARARNGEEVLTFL